MEPIMGRVDGVPPFSLDPSRFFNQPGFRKRLSTLEQTLAEYDMANQRFEVHQKDY
jgi:hypothetical protein